MKFIWAFFICVFVTVSQGARITLFDKSKAFEKTSRDFERLAKRRLIDVSHCQMGTSSQVCWPKQCPTTKRNAVTFQRPFEDTPNVLVSFTYLDIDNRANLRVNCEANDVTKDGFTLHFNTWADTKVWGYKLVWIACD